MDVSNATLTIKPTDLPSPPQAAIQIIHACSKEEVSTSELAKLAASDPLLTAELLRVVNSPFFGFAHKIQSIPRAVTVLGQRALRNLVLCVSVLDVLKKDKLASITTRFWEDGLRRATAARLLGPIFNLDRDECFTAGLLQDFGLLVLFYLNPKLIPYWSELCDQDPATRLRLEQEKFETDHAHMSFLIAKTWGLPSDLADAFKCHHDSQIDKEGADSRLANILYCADWMAAVFSANNKGLAINQCYKLLSEIFQLDRHQTENHLQEVLEQSAEAADALGLRINQNLSFEDVLREANAKLAEENISYQELTWQLEKTLIERDRLANEINQELEIAREIQRSLFPNNMSEKFPVRGINLPARELSGDFFDYFSLSDGKIYFCLGDVSGKGINAALLMVKTSSLFRCVGKNITDPNRLLSLINKEIIATSVRGMFVTMVIGLYDPKTQQTCLVNAGHQPVIIVSNKGVKMIAAEAPPLGVIAQVDFPSVDINIKNSTLYLFSDGATESCNDHGEQIGRKGMQKLFLQYNGEPPEQRLQKLIKCFETTVEHQKDDLTLLTVDSS